MKKEEMPESVIVELTKQELEDVISLLTLTLEYDTLDEPPFNYDRLDHELSNLVNGAWRSLRLLDKLEKLVPTNRKEEMKSNCCNSIIAWISQIEGPDRYQCTSCGEDCDEKNPHYCTYAPSILLDDEGYLYQGGNCCVCGREMERNYSIKLKT